MSKLNIKVVDMEPAMTEFAKKVHFDLFNNYLSQSMKPLKATVRRGSLPTK